MKQSGSQYLEKLNDVQKDAVLATEGPVIIIAGAGSGKTRVLTYRIAHLIEKGVDPFNILALTFTNKAAREMRERIENVVGNEARNIWMGTFHSIFARILRTEADKLGYPNNFSIYDTDDSKSLIKTILKEMSLSDKIYKPNVVLSRISSAKNNLINAIAYKSNNELTSYDSSAGKPYIADIYSKYADRCFKAGAMDFDDLLMKTFELFERFPEALHKYQHTFNYVMVDEYQDTNHCQYMIVKRLAAVNENICVVGDDAQSIYSFRGANIENILSFEKDYPDHKIFKLEQNYRSTKNIVRASDSIISKNKGQIKKKVWTSNQDGEKINVVRAVSDNDEGKIIAQAIFEEKMKAQRKNDAFAILYRTNAQSRSLEEALRKQNIPYRIYGGLSFYQRKEIKDLLAYLKVTINPKDEESFKRIINYPARGIGKTTIDKIIAAAGENGISLWEVVNESHLFEELRSAHGKLQDFVNMIRSFSVMVQQKNAYEVANHIAKNTGLLKVLHEDKTVEGLSRYENIMELLNAIKEFVEDDTSELEKDLGSFLQDVSLLTTQDGKDNNQDKVSLMTIHMAKGLEFDVVYISGLEENLFPSQLALGSRKELEEERRLFYVAVTRAKEKLTLSYANSRFKYGNLTACEPSRFIEDLDPQFIHWDASTVKKSGFAGLETILSGPAKKPSGVGRNHKNFIPPTKKPVAKPNFVGDDLTELKIGQKVEHQMFGLGEVESINGDGQNKKASVRFKDFGSKNLVLRFAKMKII